MLPQLLHFATASRVTPGQRDTVGGRAAVKWLAGLAKADPRVVPADGQELLLGDDAAAVCSESPDDAKASRFMVAVGRRQSEVEIRQRELEGHVPANEPAGP